MPAPFQKNDKPTYSYKYPDTPYTAPKLEINWGFWLLPILASSGLFIGLMIGLPFYNHVQETQENLKERLHNEIKFIESASCDELKDGLLYHRFYYYPDYATERFLGLGCQK